MPNIHSLRCFFNDPVYRPSEQVRGVSPILNKIVQEEYTYEGSCNTEETDYRMLVSFYAHEKLFGDSLSFLINEEKKSAQPEVKKGVRYDVPIDNIMTEHDFLYFQSMMMMPPYERDAFDQDHIMEMNMQLALRLQTKMDSFGIRSLAKTFNRPSYELQIGILDLYADYRTDIFFRKVANEKARREAGPSFRS